MFDPVERNRDDEDQQRKRGSAHVEVMAGEKTVDGIAHRRQHLRLGGEKTVEFVAFLKEMTGHAEDEFHPEHGDDDEGAGF